MKTINTESALTALSFFSQGHIIAVGNLYGNNNIFLNLIEKGSIIVYDLRKCNEPFNKYKGHEGNSINSIDFMKKENVIEFFH